MLTYNGNFKDFSGDTFDLNWFHWIDKNSAHLAAAWSLTESSPQLLECPEYTTALAAPGLTLK